MAPLAKTNRYLRDPEKRRRLVNGFGASIIRLRRRAQFKGRPTSTQACHARLGRIDKEASEQIGILC